MWIRVALDRDALHYNDPIGYTYIEGLNSEEYYFDQTVADALEADGFLLEMWSKFDALFDWGDCDFFPAEKCIKLSTWLNTRLSHEVSPIIKPVYETMLDFSIKAIKNNTGIAFDF